MSICFHPSRPRPLIPRRPNARIPFSANEHPPTASTITIVFSSSPWNTSAPPRSPSLPSLPPFRSIRARATPVSIGHARDLEPTRYLQRVIIRDEKFVIVPDDFSVPSPLPPPDFFAPSLLRLETGGSSLPPSLPISLSLSAKCVDAVTQLLRFSNNVIFQLGEE